MKMTCKQCGTELVRCHGCGGNVWRCPTCTPEQSYPVTPSVLLYGRKDS